MTTKTTKAESKPEGNAETLTARVLVDLRIGNTDYKCNQLVEAPAEVIEALEDEGQVSTADAAIVYCQEQGAEVIKHGAQPAAEQKADTKPE